MKMERNPEAGRRDVEDLVGRLKRHPTVKARVERMLDLLENTVGDVKRADEAERRVIEEVRAMGQELLGGWAQRLADTESARIAAGGGVVRQVKKTALAQHVR
jgi:hypothetical protein